MYQVIKPINIDKNLPGPEPHILFGILPYILGHREQWFTETNHRAKLYNRTWGGTLPRFPKFPPAMFYLSHEANIKHVLQDNFGNYVKGDRLNAAFKDLLGDGIFAVDGLKWKVHRQLMSRMFSRNLLRYSASNMRQKLLDALDDMKDELKKKFSMGVKAGTVKSEGSYIQIDMKDLLMRLTFDATTQLAFGLDLDTVSCIHEGNSQKKKEHPFFTAFDEMNILVYLRLHDPLFPIKRMFGIGREKRVKELVRKIDEFAMNIIKERRMKLRCAGNRTQEQGVSALASDGLSASPSNSGSRSKPANNFDLLTKYIEYGQKENESVPEQYLRDIILNVMLAGEYRRWLLPNIETTSTNFHNLNVCPTAEIGRDTTANTLTWAFYELERNPTTKQKLIQEVKQVCGTGDKAQYTYETMSKLQYTHFVALETLRMHPPVPENLRHAVKKDTLPDGTNIPAGAAIGISSCAMGRSERLWGEDASDFRPERFLEKKEPTPFEFPTFHAGPRICIGRPLALIQIKLVLSIILNSDLEFQDRVGYSGDYQMGLTMSMKDTFPMNVSWKK